MSKAMSMTSAIKVGAVKAVGELASSLGGLAGPKGAAVGAAVGAVVKVATGGKDDNDSFFPGDAKESSKTSLSNFARSEDQAKDAFKISQMKTTTREYTIGG